jgi:antitoxin YefM
MGEIDGVKIMTTQDDLRSIQETIYLLSIPGMAESIEEGLMTPIEECDIVCNWQPID